MKKYRPYLTLPELKILHQSCPYPLLTIYLHRFIEDIESGVRESNYTPAPTMPQKLGFESLEVDSKTEKKHTRRYVLFKQWEVSGTLYMNDMQFSTVQEYRFENNLMTKQEENEYVDKLMLPK